MTPIAVVRDNLSWKQAHLQQSETNCGLDNSTYSWWAVTVTHKFINLNCSKADPNGLQEIPKKCCIHNSKQMLIYSFQTLQKITKVMHRLTPALGLEENGSKNFIKGI